MFPSPSPFNPLPILNTFISTPYALLQCTLPLSPTPTHSTLTLHSALICHAVYIIWSIQIHASLTLRDQIWLIFSVLNLTPVCQYTFPSPNINIGYTSSSLIVPPLSIYYHPIITSRCLKMHALCTTFVGKSACSWQLVTWLAFSANIVPFVWR